MTDHRAQAGQTPPEARPAEAECDGFRIPARFLLRARYWIWLAVLAGAAFLWAAARPVAFDQSIEGFFPEGHAALTEYRRTRHAFGKDAFLVVAYDDPGLWSGAGMDRVRELSRDLREGVRGVGRVEALDTQRLPWEFDAFVESADDRKKRVLPRSVAGALRDAEGRPEEVESLRARLVANPLFRGLFVDGSGRSTALLVRLDPGGEADAAGAVAGVRRAADAFAERHGLDRAAVAGPPVLVADGFGNLERDNRTLGVVAMALMALALLAGARSPWWAVLPLASGWTTWLAAQALMNVLQLRPAIAAGPVVAQSVVLCMPAACHMAMRHRAALRDGLAPEDAALRALRESAPPVLWCALTAAAGYLALLASPVRPVVHFGLTMAACNLLAGALAWVLAPGAMLPPFRARPRAAAPALAAAARLPAVTDRVTRRPLLALVVFALPALALATGIGALRFESDFIKAYRDRSRVARDYRFLEDRMGGIGLAEIVFPAPGGPAPEWTAALGGLEAEVREIDGTIVTQVLSLGGILRARPEAADPDRIVETKLIVIKLLSAGVIPEFLAPPAGAGSLMRVLVRLREGADAERKEKAFAAMRDLARRRFGDEAFVTGPSVLMTRVAGAVIATQFRTTAWSLALILAMLLLALRNVEWSLLALLPTTLAVALVLGAMGWLGIRLDLSTALVASVAIGLSVDDTFHCLLRFRREIRAGLPRLEALRRSFAEAGAGVVLSSAAVSLGFLALVFSEFVPMANFGWLVAVATLGGSLGNLVVLPACLALRSRRAAATGVQTL